MKYCSKCRIDLPETYTFCKSCGGPLVVASADTPRSGSVCPSCGAEVKQGWRFCKQCAYDLQTSPAPNLSSQACRRCGSRVAAGLSFCEMCGAPVEIAQVQPVTPVGFTPAAAVAPTEVIEPDEETRVMARSPDVAEATSQFTISRPLKFGLIAGAAVVLLAVG